MQYTTCKKTVASHFASFCKLCRNLQIKAPEHNHLQKHLQAFSPVQSPPTPVEAPPLVTCDLEQHLQHVLVSFSKSGNCGAHMITATVPLSHSDEHITWFRGWHPLFVKESSLPFGIMPSTSTLVSQSVNTLSFKLTDRHIVEPR